MGFAGFTAKLAGLVDTRELAEAADGDVPSWDAAASLWTPAAAGGGAAPLDWIQCYGLSSGAELSSSAVAKLPFDPGSTEQGGTQLTLNSNGTDIDALANGIYAVHGWFSSSIAAGSPGTWTARLYHPGWFSHFQARGITAGDTVDVQAVFIVQNPGAQFSLRAFSSSVDAANRIKVVGNIAIARLGPATPPQ